MTSRRGGAVIALAGLLAILVGGVWLVGRDRPAGTPARLAAAAPGRPVTLPWTRAQLTDLVEAVRGADAEGLRASDYHFAALRTAADAGRSGVAVDALADRAAAALAHDFAAGHVTNRHRFNWYIDHAGPGPAELARGIAAARAKGDLREWLAGLLPTSAAYRALREALAATPSDDADRRDRLRANMERWRWLPRDFEQGDRLYVNLPTYRLDVIEAGSVVATYKAVIGATDMPTPVLSVPVRQVIANPDWIVPQSIVRRSHLRPGASSRYIFTTRPDGTLRVRQKPGPGNALGRVKIVFPNALAIYFHDTPSKSLFGASARTFSHGCVRVQNIDALAASLVADPDRFAAALAGAKTRGFTPAHGWLATITYLTLVPGDGDGNGNGGALVDVGDPYRLDEPLAAALDGRPRRRAKPVEVPAVQAPEPTPATGPEPAPPVAPPADPTPPPLAEPRQPPPTPAASPSAEPPPQG